MKIVDTLEQTLGGGFKGLHGEVVTEDCYRITKLDFEPDVVFDIGGNVGTFTRHARSLFANARIVAVEPHKENSIHFRKFTNMENVTLLDAALGNGRIHHMNGAVNGAHEVYLSVGLGYTQELFDTNPVAAPVGVKSMSLADIVLPHYESGMKAVLKIDCEGGENCLWEDEESLKLMRRFDYIAIELHYHVAHGGFSDDVHRITNAALDSFDATHECHRGRIYFTARKKKHVNKNKNQTR